ncbi:MAG TPA: hypothetical protein VK014_09750 [Cyclobacteriaceae bacterium]|nr:hypothetical protein [Cyclobacteriaceae bacterium]
MKERLELLLEKYYNADTTLAEERELRQLLQKVNGFELEKEFVLGLQIIKAKEPINRPRPKENDYMPLWQKVAAVLLVSAGLTWWFVDRQIDRQQERAYAQVMEAFDLIQKNMEKGAVSLKPIQDMKYLNVTNEIFNINTEEEQ